MPETAPARRTRRVIQTRVEDVRRLTPHLIRVVVGGEDLEGFAAGEFTDHYVKLQIPPPGARTRRRSTPTTSRRACRASSGRARARYTVRDWDPERARLTIDFVDHGDVGVAGPWAAAAQPGDVPAAHRARAARYAPDPAADWHLMVGDERRPGDRGLAGAGPGGRAVHVSRGRRPGGRDRARDAGRPARDLAAPRGGRRRRARSRPSARSTFPAGARPRVRPRRGRGGPRAAPAPASSTAASPATRCRSPATGSAADRRGLARGQGGVEPPGGGGRGRLTSGRPAVSPPRAPRSPRPPRRPRPPRARPR